MYLFSKNIITVEFDHQLDFFFTIHRFELKKNVYIYFMTSTINDIIYIFFIKMMFTIKNLKKKKQCVIINYNFYVKKKKIINFL